LEVLLDERLGNIPKYYLGEKGDRLMLVPDEVRKCVVFICYESTKGLSLAGTGFFISVSSDIPERIYVYLATAKHVIKKIEEKSIDNNVFIRINQRNNKPSALIRSNLAEWKYHPSESNVDVAVLPWSPDSSVYDFRVLSSGMAVTQEIITKEGIGCGDEVFLTGLFGSHYGKQRNQPIIRIGNIASMPEERVATKEMGEIEAYLIEARSIGGLSGSPVFVHISGVRKGALSLGKEPIYWLGMVHGHYDLPELDSLDTLSKDSLVNLVINMGVAIVIPSTKVLEVLNQKELVEDRAKGDEIERKKIAPTPDSI
jgi:hypothetical protein